MLLETQLVQLLIELVHVEQGYEQVSHDPVVDVFIFTVPFGQTDRHTEFSK
jgi:hypothetical protein